MTPSRRFIAAAALLMVASSNVCHRAAAADQLDLKKCIDSIANKPKVGRLGAGILNLDSGERYLLNGTDGFPLQSVFKLPLAAVVLEQVEAGKLTLDQKIAVKSSDLSVFYSPLAEHFVGPEQQFTVANLLERAVQESDNSAADLLMSKIGGPSALTESLESHGITGMRVDRYEREAQPAIFGLPPFKIGQTIDRAKFNRDVAHARSVKAHAAFDYYLYKDTRDTCTPDAMLTFLQKLYKGELLNSTSTKYLLKIMTGTKTGPNRLHAGAPSGSIVGHKTGTGPTLDGVNTATNDVGIITLPSGKHFAIAVFLSGSTLGEAQRDKVIAEVCKCAVAH